MKFEPLSLKHKARFKALQKNTLFWNDYYGSECMFSNMFVWKDDEEVFISDLGNALILRCTYQNERVFLPPITSTKANFQKAFMVLLAYSHENQIPFVMNGLTKNLIQALPNDLANTVTLSQSHLAEYLYDPVALISLSGNKYAAKRNHLNAYAKVGTKSFRDYTDDDLMGVLQLIDAWGNATKGAHVEKGVIMNALTHRDALDLFCDVIVVKHRIVAFSISMVSFNNIGIVLFEKADTSVNGIYAAINQLVAEKRFANVRYINRQEDMGIPSLRRAKLSYHPSSMADKYMIRIDPLMAKLKDLYTQCFDDSINYVDYFFLHKFNPHQVFYHEENQTLVSALHLIDKTLCYESKNVYCPFVVAAGTLPQYRHQGHFRTVLKIAFQQLHAKGTIFSGLNPFDAPYYEQFGFVSIYQVKTIRIRHQNKDQYTYHKTTDALALSKIYGQMLKDKDGFILRDKCFYEAYLSELSSDGIEFEIVKKNGIERGYLAHKNKGIEELCMFDYREAEILSRFCDQEFKSPTDQGGEPFTMVRIIDVKAALFMYDFDIVENHCFSFRITDCFIPENNMTITLDVAHGHKRIETANTSDFTISIESLTRLLFLGNINQKEHPFYRMFKVKSHFYLDRY